MGSPYVSKTVKLSPQLDEEISAAMEEIGSDNFSDFVKRALKNQIIYEKKRLRILEDMATEPLVAAEDRAQYNAPPPATEKPNGDVPIAE